jgi:hypothetical protein
MCAPMVKTGDIITGGNINGQLNASQTEFGELAEVNGLKLNQPNARSRHSLQLHVLI